MLVERIGNYLLAAAVLLAIAADCARYVHALIAAVLWYCSGACLAAAVLWKLCVDLLVRLRIVAKPAPDNRSEVEYPPPRMASPPIAEPYAPGPIAPPMQHEPPANFPKRPRRRRGPVPDFPPKSEPPIFDFAIKGGVIPSKTDDPANAASWIVNLDDKH